jgi:hypothetical protein
MDETVAGTIIPNIAIWQDRACVSLPCRSWIAGVDWKQGKVLRNLMVGGMATRLVLIEAK